MVTAVVAVYGAVLAYGEEHTVDLRIATWYQNYVYFAGGQPAAAPA